MVVWAARPVKQYFGDNINKLWMIMQMLQHRDQSAGKAAPVFLLAPNIDARPRTGTDAQKPGSGRK